MLIFDKIMSLDDGLVGVFVCGGGVFGIFNESAINDLVLVKLKLVGDFNWLALLSKLTFDVICGSKLCKPESNCDCCGVRYIPSCCRSCNDWSFWESLRVVGFLAVL